MKKINITTIAGIALLAIAFSVAGKFTHYPVTTTLWGDDYAKAHPQVFTGPFRVEHYRFIELRSGHGPSYEFGLRSDGVVVWREIKP